MKPLRRPRVMFFHAVKTWAVMVVTFIPLFVLADYLPMWAFNTLFLALAFLIFFPVVFAVGPLGRRIGRPLNEMAIAQAQREREALGARTSYDRGENQSTKREGND